MPETLKSEEIKLLIPHRMPFLFVDEILSADESEITGTKTFCEADFRYNFSNYNSAPNLILLESLVQCGGAGVRKIGITSGVFGLASIEFANFIKNPEIGQTIKYIIKNIKLSNKLIRQSGIALIGEVVFLEASWLCVRIS